LGFGPSSRYHTHAATSREASQASRRSVLELSQLLDGFLRARACELVSSRYHVQGSLCSGASLPAQPPFLVGRSLPPCRCFTVASSVLSRFHRSERIPTCDAPRLRGLYPCETAFHEIGYSPCPCPLPSSVSSPPGPFFPRWVHSFPPHTPLMMLRDKSPHIARNLAAPCTGRSPVLAHLQRPAIESVGSSSPTSPPCSSF
jgi:hypothetical protein